MRFCEKCGSYMERTARDMICPKCGNKVQTDIVEVRRPRRVPPEPVYVVGDFGDEVPKVSQICPQCGNNHAYHLIFSTQGEHAGVKQDRTVERFRCTKCLYTWTKS